MFDYSTSEFQVTKATKCPTENDKKCQSFWHQLFMYPGQNLREGLKCLRYDGNITSNQGAKYLGFFSSCSLKWREKYISFAQLVLLSLYIF